MAREQTRSGVGKDWWAWAFWALFNASALWLAVGGVPAWAEKTILGLFWALIVFVLSIVVLVAVVGLLCLAFGIWPGQAWGSAEDEAKPVSRGRRRWLFRALQIAFLCLLVAAGQGLLASLYFSAFFLLGVMVIYAKSCKPGLDPSTLAWPKRVVYYLVASCVGALRGLWRAVKWIWLPAKWLFWILPAFAVLACMTHGGYRLRRRRLRALGLTYGLVAALYGRPYRLFWRTLFPSAFWLTCLGLAVALAIGVLPSEAAGAVSDALWIAVLSMATNAFMALTVLFWFDEQAPGWHRAVRRSGVERWGGYLRALCGLGAAAVLWIAGSPVLGALIVCILVMLAGLSVYYEQDLLKEEEELSDPLAATAYILAMCLVLVPFLILAMPLLLLYLPLVYWPDMKAWRDLRLAHGMAGPFIYLVYGEDHQRARLLGAGGVLAAYAGRVVARDWREDITPARQALGWTRFQETAEGHLLHELGVSNRRAHLPLIAVVYPLRWVQAFRLSEAYRSRGRDGGDALQKLERQVAKKLRSALGPPAARPSP